MVVIGNAARIARPILTLFRVLTYINSTFFFFVGRESLLFNLKVISIH